MVVVHGMTVGRKGRCFKRALGLPVSATASGAAVLTTAIVLRWLRRGAACSCTAAVVVVHVVLPALTPVTAHPLPSRPLRGAGQAADGGPGPGPAPALLFLFLVFCFYAPRPAGPYAVLVKLQMEAQAKRQQAEEPEAAVEEGVEEGVPEGDGLEGHLYDKQVSGALVAPAPDSGLAPTPLGGDGGPYGKGHSGVLVTSYDGASAGPGAGKGSGVAQQTSGSLAITLPHSVPAAMDAPKSGSGHVAQPAPRSGEKGAPVSAAGADGAEQGQGQGGKDGKEAKEEPYHVPFKRLLSYAEGEGLACVIGCFASACAGAQHPAFAFVSEWGLGWVGDWA